MVLELTVVRFDKVAYSDNWCLPAYNFDSHFYTGAFFVYRLVALEGKSGYF